MLPVWPFEPPFVRLCFNNLISPTPNVAKMCDDLHLRE